MLDHSYRHLHVVCVMCVQVEENVLDYLAWTSDSPLYDAIEAAGSAPSYEDVALPPPTAGGVATPLVHPTHSRVVSSLTGLRGEGLIGSLRCWPDSYLYSSPEHQLLHEFVTD